MLSGRKIQERNIRKQAIVQGALKVFNNSGIGIQSENSDFYLQNVTMANNEYGISSVALDEIDRSSGYIISNSIIWNSPIYLSVSNESQTMFVSYSNYSGMTDDGVYYAGQDAIETLGNPNIVWGTIDGNDIINNNTLFSSYTNPNINPN